MPGRMDDRQPMENSTKKWVTVLGASGSIGTNTLDVMVRHPEQFGLFAITAATQVDKMLALCMRHQPRYAVMASVAHANLLRQQCRELNLRTEILAGEEGLVDVAAHPDVDMVMAAIVGSAGLAPCLAAASAGKRLLLANKEALVVGGLFSSRPSSRGAPLCCPSTANIPPFFSPCHKILPLGSNRWKKSF